jgi:hypothetical protein
MSALANLNPLPPQRKRPRPRRTPRMSSFKESPTWTTADEMAYVKGLWERGNCRALEEWLRVSEHRVWRGFGMAVELEVVRQQVREWLKEG